MMAKPSGVEIPTTRLSHTSKKEKKTPKREREREREREQSMRAKASAAAAAAAVGCLCVLSYRLPSIPEKKIFYFFWLQIVATDRKRTRSQMKKAF
jgi:hypothetical protein